MPFGLFWSDAILAKNFKGATPAEAVSFNSCAMAWRIASAIQVAEPEQCALSVTSKKASSSESGSIMSV